MSAVRSDIGRINEVKRLLAVVAFDEVCAILTLDGHILEPAAELLGKGILGVAQLLRCCSRTVVAKCAIEHRCEAELRAYPHCPSTLYGSEELRVLVNMLGVGVYLAAVERGIDKLFERGILALRHLVEVDKLGVDVVDDLTFCRLLGKEHCAATAERLGVECVFGNQREDVFEEGLLTSVVGYRCFHRLGFT